MEIRAQTIDGLNVAVVSGRVNHASSGCFSEDLEPYLAACTESSLPLVLDMSGVDYISSAGLRVLMVAARRIKSQGGRFGIAAIQPMVQEVFTISKFHLVLPCFNDIETARKGLSNRNLESGNE